MNHANSDESTGTLRGIFTGSSVTRNGLKVRLQSAGQGRKHNDKKNNFLVLNAVTTHRVPTVMATQPVSPITHQYNTLTMTKDSTN